MTINLGPLSPRVVALAIGAAAATGLVAGGAVLASGSGEPDPAPTASVGATTPAESSPSEPSTAESGGQTDVTRKATSTPEKTKKPKDSKTPDPTDSPTAASSAPTQSSPQATTAPAPTPPITTPAQTTEAAQPPATGEGG
jgi:hypothetical protein